MMRGRSSAFGTVIEMLAVASGSGISQMPILVTMPKFDCMKTWSQEGPKPYL